MAAQILFVFPYSRLNTDPDKSDLGKLAIGFLVYFALDVGFLCTFCGVGVLSHDIGLISDSPVLNGRPSFIRHKWTQVVLWNALVAILLAASAVFGYYLFDLLESEDPNALNDIFYWDKG